MATPTTEDVPRRRAARHSAPPSRGRRIRGLLALVVAAALLVTGVGFGIRALRGGGDGTTAGAAPASCKPSALQVAADPAIAPALVTAARSFPNDKACVTLQVTAVDSATMAATMARPVGAGLGDRLPDLWVPDSALWVQSARATETGGNRLAGDGTVLASSPLVVAVAEPAAKTLGWPEKSPTWSALTAAKNLKVGLPDPGRTSAGLSALLAGLGDSPTPETVTTARLGAVSQRLTVPSTRGVSPATLVGSGELQAVPTSEADVLAVRRAGKTTVSVATAYDEALGAPLDFPLHQVTRETGQVLATKDFPAVREALEAAVAAADLGALGLRNAKGDVIEGSEEALGVEPAKSTATVEASAATAPALIAKAEDTWALVGRRARLLIVVDRSGSMRHPLPGGTKPMADLAQASVRELVEGAPADSDIGLWSFTTGEPGADIRTLVPLRRLSSSAGSTDQRTALLRAVPKLDPSERGDTPLHRAIAAAYASASENYAYGRLNAVVVVTDGKNDDPNGKLTQSALVNQLRLAYDGIRPVRIIALGYGAGSDIKALRTIADVTGGKSFQGLTEREAQTLLAATLAEM